MPNIEATITLKDNASSVCMKLFSSLNKIEQLLTKISLDTNKIATSFNNVDGSAKKVTDTVSKTNTTQQKLNSILKNTEITNKKLLDIEKKIKTATDNNSKAQQRHNSYLRGANIEANKLLSTLKQAVSVYSIYQGAKNTLGLADTVAQTKARLNIVKELNGTLSKNADVEQMIYEASMRSRGSYLDMAKVVSGLGVRAADAFGSTEEIVQFTETLNKMGVVSGTSANEISNALYQINQAMGAGKFQGDEFRSVSENLPLALEAVAKYKKVSVGALKDLAKKGEITSDVFKKAIFSMADEIDDRFKKMPITWGQIWNIMKNQMLMASRPLLDSISNITKSERFIGFVQNLSMMFQKFIRIVTNGFNKLKKVAAYMYDNWDKLKSSIYSLVTAYIVYKSAMTAAGVVASIITIKDTILEARRLRLAKATFAATVQQTSLNAAMLSSPITWVIGGLVILIGVLATLVLSTYDFEKANIDVWGTIKNVARAAADFIKGAWDRLYQILKPLIEAIGDTFSRVGENIANNWSKICDVVSTIIGFFAWLGKIGRTVLGWLVEALVIVWKTLCWVCDLVISIGEFIVNNWSFIAPIVWGIVGAIAAYKLAVMGLWLWTKITTIATKVWAGVTATCKFIMGLFTGATWAQVAAQWGLNAAIYACPIFWIILAVIAFIVIIYLAVAAINRFAGTAYSGTGVVAGCFMALGAYVWNSVKFMWNSFAAFVEFFVNVWTEPMYSVKKLFVNLAVNVIDCFIAMTKGCDEFATNFANAILSAINTVLDGWNWMVDKLGIVGEKMGLGKASHFEARTSITSDLKDAKASLEAIVADKPAGYWEAPKAKMTSVGDAYMKGYKWGENLANSIEGWGNNLGGDFDMDKMGKNLESLIAKSDPSKIQPYDNDVEKALNGGYDGKNPALDKIKGDTGKIADGVGSAANSLDKASEDTKYLRELAEREAINKYTLTDLNVNMTNHNTMNSDVDVDNFGRRLWGALVKNARRTVPVSY